MPDELLKPPRELRAGVRGYWGRGREIAKGPLLTIPILEPLKLSGAVTEA